MAKEEIQVLATRAASVAGTSVTPSLAPSSFFLFC